LTEKLIKSSTLGMMPPAFFKPMAMWYELASVCRNWR
jgi:hypothetical protein